MQHHPFTPPSRQQHPKPYSRVAVVGAGAWGTAVATTFAKAGVKTRLWGRDADLCKIINDTGENARYLPGIKLPDLLSAEADMASAVKDAEMVAIVVPSRTVRDVSQQMAQYLPKGIPVVVCAKGIEAESSFLMAQIVEDELPGHPVGCISGPTFAAETALGHPTAATVAFAFRHEDRLDPGNSPAVRTALSLTTESFRAYVSDDLVGVEIGGAVKNVIAIACGMMTGAGFAENTRAALITRGVDEMKVLAEALGGRRETVTGLSGMGDLTLTCSSPTSRNMSLGLQLGKGTPRAECFEGRPVVVEGEMNARTVTDLARRVGVTMPICEAVRDILHHGADLGETFAALWSRPIEAEPRTLDLSFNHPASETAVQQLAERFS